jgi:predicted RNA binding protein YcfA (HicA-like mRNA interferase family)
VSPLPVVSGGEVVKALSKIGDTLDRQRGSHMILRQHGPPHRRLSVPDHQEVPTSPFEALPGKPSSVKQAAPPRTWRWTEISANSRSR